MLELHHLSYAQLELLGELRTGPQWDGGLRKRTFRALQRRGLVVAVEQGDLNTKWKLSADGARLVLAEKIVLPKWRRVRRQVGAATNPGN